MGRVVVEVVVKNVEDLRRAERGELPVEQVRSSRVDALVDSGVAFFCLPEHTIKLLGLPFNRNRPTRTVSGECVMRIYGGARIEIQGRSCDLEVMGLPDECRALLGQLPLETLDFWVDSSGQRLVGNPEHGGQWMAEVF